MKKNLYLGALLVSTILSSSVAVGIPNEKEIREGFEFIKRHNFEKEVLSIISSLAGRNISTVEEAVNLYNNIPAGQENKYLQFVEDKVNNLLLAKVNSILGRNYASIELYGEAAERGDFTLTQQQAELLKNLEDNLNNVLIVGTDAREIEYRNNKTTYKLQAKTAKIFGQNPELMAIMSKLNNMEDNAETATFLKSADGQKLLNSQEFLKYINSPEMQEKLKYYVQDIKEEVALMEKNSASQDQIKNRLKAEYELASMFGFANTDNVRDSSKFTPLQKQDTGATDGLLAAAQVNLVESVIDNRLISTTGIASGDEPLSYGMWVRGMFSQAKQGSYKLTPGYKLNQHGVTIGFDLGEEDKRIGIAYSFVDSKVKGKNTGIKDKLKSHIGTVYGLYQFPNNMFVDGQIRYGKSNIKKTRDNGNLSGDISSAKPKGTIIGGKVEVGYDYALENKIHLIPTIGISADQLEIKGYKEKGEGINRNIAKRTAKRTSALAGLRVSKAIDNGSFTMIPEIHANLIYAMQSKNPNTKVTLFDGMDPMVIPSGKTPKASYKIGGSVKFVKCQKVDLGIGYDCGLSKKFQSHSGYFNARYNF